MKNYFYGFTRFSDDEILHLVSTATILLDLPIVTKEVIILALLHDSYYFGEKCVVEISKEFGNEIATLVQIYNEIAEKEIFVPNTDPEVLIRFLINRAKDLRVILVILANRIDDLKRGRYFSVSQNLNKSKEALYILSPIADRLGIGKFKFELENLAFKTLNYSDYKWIENFVLERKEEYEKLLLDVKNKLVEKMKEQKVKGEIVYRIKNIYSIYSKVVLKYNRDLRKISDFAGIRVIVSNISDCYKVLLICSSVWMQENERFKDYISNPKPNGYKSIHSTFFDKNGKSFEVQIRTKKMHEVAEFGLAARWKYNEFKKTSEYKENKSSINSKSNFLIEYLANWESKILNQVSTITVLENKSEKETIFVSTPKRDVLEIEKGAVILDVAFKIHTKVGEKCIGGKVNGKMVGIDYELKDADVIEIVVNENCKGPTEGWLQIVKTSFAKKHIKSFLRRKQKNEKSISGAEIFETEIVTKYGKDIFRLAKKALKKEENLLGFKSLEMFFVAIFDGEVSVEKFLKNADLIKIDDENKNSLIKKLVAQSDKKEDLLKTFEGINYSVAICCAPKRQDPVIGFVSKSKGIVLHKINCKNLIHTDLKNLIDVSWLGLNKAENFKISVQIFSEKFSDQDLEILKNFNQNIEDIVVQHIDEGILIDFFVKNLRNMIEARKFLDDLKFLSFCKNVRSAKLVKIF